MAQKNDYKNNAADKREKLTFEEHIRQRSNSDSVFSVFDPKTGKTTEYGGRTGNGNKNRK